MSCKRVVIKSSIITVAVLCLLVAIVWVAASPVAKYVVNNYGEQIIGRQMHAERVMVNVMGGRVRIRDFAMKEADDQTPFVEFAELDVKADLWQLLRRTVDVRYVKLTGARCRIEQNGTKFNFDDIIEFYATPDSLATSSSAAEPASQEPSQEWEIAINNISVKGSTAEYRDLALDARWGMNNIDLMVPALYFSSRKSDVDLEFNFAEGGKLRTSLAYNMQQGDYAVRLNIDRLTLHGVLPYVKSMLNIGSCDGLLSMAVDVSGNLNHVLDFDARGTADVSQFEMTDAAGGKLLNVDTLHIGVRSVSLLNNFCKLDTVMLRGVNIAAVRERNGDVNWLKIVKESATSESAVATEIAPAADSATVATKTPFALTADEILLSKIHVDYTDRTMRQNFDYALSDVSFRCRNFDLNGINRAAISSRLGNGGRARVMWSGSLSDMNNQKLNVEVENVRVRDFSPFCYDYTAYPLVGGNMTFASNNVVSDGHLTSKNHIDVYQCTAGTKTKEFKPEYKIPLKLGLYLLKDMHEHIIMDIPVSGTLGSPSFSFRKIVFKTIANAILKVVACPFMFLKGNGAATLQDVRIDAAQYGFTTQQYESLDTIIEALRTKPEMAVSLTQYISLDGLQEKIEQMSLNRDYYNSTVLKPTDMLAPFDTERIAALSYTDAELNGFADAELAKGGMTADSTMTLTQKRERLYADKAARAIERLKQARNELIYDYVVVQNAIPERSFKVQSADSVSQAAYAGRSRYAIAIGVDGETEEVDTAAQNAEEATVVANN